MVKWPFLHYKHGLTPLEKCQFFDFLNFVFSLLRKMFLVLEYRKRHFPALYCLKKNVGKMAIFGPKAWKNVNFLTFGTFRFYRIERCCLLLEYRKTRFPGLYCLKKMTIFGPKAWVNPLEKCQFFNFLNCFFIAYKVFFWF